MNRLNRIFRARTSRHSGFARNLLRYFMPKAFLQRRLARMLAAARRRDDWEEIRASPIHCNSTRRRGKQPPQRCPADYRPLGDHRLRRGVRTAYSSTPMGSPAGSTTGCCAADPGRRNDGAALPAVVKSRPIAGDNAASVLLNLDKARHFVFLRDDIPSGRREDRAIFRLTINCHHPNHVLRRRFMERYFGSEICDAGISNRHPSLPPEWTKPRISLYDHLKYKFVLAIEGQRRGDESRGSCRPIRWP